jgi:hypothetical protein
LAGGGGAMAGDGVACCLWQVMVLHVLFAAGFTTVSRWSLHFNQQSTK